MQTRKMDEAKISGALKGMEKCLGEIETVWLANGEKQFLAGDAISVTFGLVSRLFYVD